VPTPDLSLKEIIWQIVASIPKGKVATYGQIAKAAGYPGHARYVGSTLKNLPKDTKLPWHRVINSQGRISFPINSSAYNKQKSRLEAEGVVFNNETLCLKKFSSLQEYQ
jgi:methylated-DNA-protein-cysteine methyltransferase-like protein